jgi:hypothetical protein
MLRVILRDSGDMLIFIKLTKYSPYTIMPYMRFL